MFLMDLLTVRGLTCLTVCCLLLPAEGNEIVLQENAEDIIITPETFPNKTTSITIASPTGYRVLLKFVRIELESGRLDLYNRIGKEGTSQCILSISGRLHPPPPHLTSPGQHLLILLSHGPYLPSEDMFLINATLVEEKASSIQLGPSETRNITSPFYPFTYPRLAFSFITIAAPRGCRLKYQFVAFDIAEDTLCVSERRVAHNTDRCDVIKIGAVKRMSGSFASLWFSSDFSSKGRGFLVSFTSIGQSDDTPCTDRLYRVIGLSPAPGGYSLNTARKQTRQKRASQNGGGNNSEPTFQSTETTPKPWHQYTLLQQAGVLLAVVVIGIFLNQLTRHLMDLCCQKQQRVTMATPLPPPSPQGRNRVRTKSWVFPTWKLGERKSCSNTVKSSDDLAGVSGKGEGKYGDTSDSNRETDYITMGRIENSSRDLPKSNPSAVSETSRSDNIKLLVTEGTTTTGTHAQSGSITRMSKKGAPDPSDDNPEHQSHILSSPRCGDEKPPVITTHRKSQSSLLEGDTYITGKFAEAELPDPGTPSQRTVFKQPSSVSHVRLREQSSFNSLVAFNKRTSISMFDLTDNDLEDHFGLDMQLGLHGQNTSNELAPQNYNPRIEQTPIRRREYDGLTSYQWRIANPGNRTNFGDVSVFTPEDQSISSSTDSLPMTCGDDGVQWYSPIDQENKIARNEDRYSTAMAKFDILCNNLQAEVKDISSELPTYANLPPLRRKRFATFRSPSRSKPRHLKTPKVVQRSQSTSAHDLTFSLRGTPGIDVPTRSNREDNTSLINATSSSSHTPHNLLSSCLKNPVSMERSVTTPEGSHTTFGKSDRVISAYRSYCEIDDIEPGCGVETSEDVTDPHGYNLTSIRLHGLGIE